MTDLGKSPIPMQGSIDLNKSADQLGSLVTWAAHNNRKSQGCIFEVVNHSGWTFKYEGWFGPQGEIHTEPGQQPPTQWQIPHVSSEEVGYFVAEGGAGGLNGLIGGLFFSNGGRGPYLMFGCCVRNLGGQGASTLLSAYVGGRDLYEDSQSGAGSDSLFTALQNPKALPRYITANTFETSTPQNKQVDVSSSFGSAALKVTGQMTWIDTDDPPRNLWHASFELN
jgi:hypothetical protein